VPLRSKLVPFAAGVVVGAFARAAYPKLKEQYGPRVKEALAPLASSALSGVRDAVSEAARAASRAAAADRAG
jgi:hypothetical protein